MRLCTEYAHSGKSDGNESDNSMSNTGRCSMFANDSVRDRAAVKEKSGEGEGDPAAIRDSHDEDEWSRSATLALRSDLYHPTVVERFC